MAARLAEGDGATRRRFVECTDDAHVLPATLHPSFPAFLEIHSCNIAAAANCQSAEVVYAGGADDLEADAAVQAEYALLQTVWHTFANMR